ncbi:GntR family transcriptional regulator [Bombilactobacillus thymidiniphilus]|uniref:GntR family transcriptional regulator n=1 Tax=Bombilactobacillus thymidiniphilus TaxID=2923363 RepID=A0ABY4PC44_9LACO|nr:GntR family transcriptional regulator [Bombilactobacillus thymidiniphilus]UQS83076.1 GntR family transcriptional regulator [Bombilactobacillus thymidiniphilus]
MKKPLYMQIAQTIKQNIIDEKYPHWRLPDERTLADNFAVSRSSIKRAVQVLADQGIIFKKQGAGNFVNPLFLRNQTSLDYTGDNVGLTTSIVTNGQAQKITVLDLNVVQPTAEIQQNLFLTADDFVYVFQRLRSLDDTPILVETSYIPVRLLPNLSHKVLEQSLFNYLEVHDNKIINRSYLDITVAPSTLTDQKLLHLTSEQPVGVVNGIFFTDDGLPFEYSSMRLHYQFFNFATFVDLNK